MVSCGEQVYGARRAARDSSNRFVSVRYICLCRGSFHLCCRLFRYRLYYQHGVWVPDVSRANPAHLLLETHLRELKLAFESEVRFYPKRKWRADYFVRSLSNERVLVEIEGGVWSKGRHTRGKGYLADMEKYRVAAALGYKVFRFSTQEIMNGAAKEFLRKWL